MAKSKTGKWIQAAVSKHPGKLTAKAKGAGMSIPEFCAQGNLDAETQKECSLRKTLMSFHK